MCCTSTLDRFESLGAGAGSASHFKERKSLRLPEKSTDQCYHRSHSLEFQHSIVIPNNILLQPKLHLFFIIMPQNDGENF